ncbi:MAG TPA: S8 family serine peptidase [Chloroflexota bacterium]
MFESEGPEEPAIDQDGILDAGTRSEEENRPGCLQYGLFVLASLWVLGVSFGVQSLAWIIGQALLVAEQSVPAIAWVGITWVQGLLVLVPVGALALLTRPGRLRAVYTAWAAAAAFVWLFALARLAPSIPTSASFVAQAALAAVAMLVIARIARRRAPQPALEVRSAVGALPYAALLVAPWVVFGALGSPLDTTMAVLAGLLFGAFAGIFLETVLFAPLGEQAGRRLIFGGFSAGVALAVLASGFGYGGNQLLLMVALPAIGFAVAALGSSTTGPAHRGVPAALLLGSVTAAALAFFDPQELTLLLDQGGEGDIPTWAAAATGATVLLAWLAGIVAAFLSRAPEAGRTARGSGVSAWVAWLAVAALYLLAGQPGFFGDRLFVIMKDQADLSPAYAMADRAQRTGYVYHTLTERASTTQMPLRADLDRLGIPYRPYYLVNAIEVDADPWLRLYLADRPDVDRVLDSPRLRPLREPQPVQTGDAGAPSGPGWNITSIGVDRVWRELGVTGRGVVVGQSDSGVDGSHIALRDSYRGRQRGDAYNWLDPWYHTKSPTDDGGHGTHTLGSVLGKGGIGIAPDAEWFACSNLPRNLGNPARYLDCMQFMLAPYPDGADPFAAGDPSLAAMVTNNSWGCPYEEGCDANALLPAARAFRAAGIFMAVSAGNSGPRCGSLLDPLAIYAEVFSVGAVDSGGNLATFSSRGPVRIDSSDRVKPDIAAPGVDVLSSYPRDSYKVVSGTSMAGPHVAGVVALMWSAQPRLIGDVDRTAQILRDTAKPYTGKREGCFQGDKPSDAFGYGLLDAYAAVKAAIEMK